MSMATKRLSVLMHRFQIRFPLLAGFMMVVSCTTPQTQPPLSVGGSAILPDQIPDPLEPMNRGVWAVNRGVIDYFLSPVGRGYRMVVPKPVRNSISRVSYNVGYPGRALNQLLQGRMADAGDESLRFATNTTVGLLGVIDVASKMDIPKHKGNFHQTFQQWGWQGGKTYLMLPGVGPSDEMDVVGFGCDQLADPLNYNRISRWVSYSFKFNDRAEDVDQLQRFIESDPDAYATLKAIWTYQSRGYSPDWSMHAPQHPPTLETLAVASLKLQDPAFVEKGDETTVRIPTTGKRLPFNYWLQDGPAPLVYVVPGLGSHRLTMQALSVVENLHRRGFAVVCISGLFHPEFINNASSAQVQGYAPYDRADMAIALGQIDKWMQKKHGKRLGARALVGCSMGGFQTLALAAEQSRKGGTAAPLFEKFVAINPPVDLHHGLECLDGFYEAPLVWPEAVRQQRVNNAIHKVVAMIDAPSRTERVIPIDGTESKYLIGLVFRMTLRGAIYESQRRHDLGLLQQPLSYWSREPVYDEIMEISFADYFKKFVIFSYRKQGVDTSGFERDGNLRYSAPELSRLPNTHVITSRNDFLLSAGDIGWLKRTFGAKRLVLLDGGGHMGALVRPEVHDLIASILLDLKTR